MKPLPLKIDLHLHTCYSCDATSSLREIIVFAKKKGLNGVAITDHDTTKGARRALKLASSMREFKVIPGVEVSTLQGHVLALNITSLIPKRLGLVETVEKIHEAGGIAVAAHPIVFVKSQMKQRTASVANLDGVEVINSSAFPFFLSTRLNQALAERLSLPQTAGSDAHHASEIGTAYTLVKVDSDIDEIIEAIRKGAATPLGKAISWEKRVKRSALRLKMWI